MHLRHFRRLCVLAVFFTGICGATLRSSASGLPTSPRTPFLSTVPSIGLTGPAGPQPLDKPIDIAVDISDAASLAAFEVDLIYDPSLVQFSGVTAGAFLGKTSNCDALSSRCAVLLGPRAQIGSISMGAYSYGAGPGASGSGEVAVVHLQPTGKAGTLVLNLANPLLADVTANPITPVVQGTIIVLQPSVSPSKRLLLPMITR